MAKQQRNHEDTWGANEAVKEQWANENSEPARKATETENRRQSKVAKGDKDA